MRFLASLQVRADGPAGWLNWLIRFFIVYFAYSASLINVFLNNTSFHVSCLLLFALLLFPMRRLSACCNAVPG